MKNGVAKASAHPMAQSDNFSISSDSDLEGREPDTLERHVLIRKTVASLMDASGGVGRVRGLRGEAPGFDKQLWKKMADLGWLGIPVPEEFGGLGLGIRDMCVVAHELGKWLAPEPLAASVALATGVIWRGQNIALKDQLLSQAVSGEMGMAMAWQEQVGNIDIAGKNATSASRRGNEIRINGRKIFVHGASDGFIVSAFGGDDPGIYWIPRDARGLTVTPVQLADGTFANDLSLENVDVSVDSIVASGETANAVLTAAIDDAMVVVSAELLGIMDAVLQQTLEYLRTRVQFGRPIGEFQALQHRAVDLLMAKELASCALSDAIDTFESETNLDRRAEAAMRVKFRASRSALAIASAAVHLHGAMGFTDECNVGLYLKRVIVLNAWLGNSDLQLQRLSNQIGWLTRAWQRPCLRKA